MALLRAEQAREHTRNAAQIKAHLRELLAAGVAVAEVQALAISQLVARVIVPGDGSAVTIEAR
jgi:hypothetical protein